MLECVFLGLMFSQEAKLSEKEILRNVWDASVMVSVKTPSGRGALTESGSGTVILSKKDSFVVLTCAHVLTGVNNPKAKLTVFHHESYQTYPARVLARCPRRDVALLEVQARDHKARAVKVAREESYARNSLAYRCGFPASRVRETARCSVLSSNSHLGDEPEATLVEATPPAAQGNSGGGLFSGKSGRLIGVTVVTNGHSMGASSLKSIHYILKQANLNLEN